jgi:NitT/TauT family transport system ATP-binding protein
VEIRIEGVSHRYGDLIALEDINLTIREGEIVALVGPSGCGKSTLLNIIGGLLKPANGKVLLRGHPGPDCINPLTYVFQDFALLPWRTVAGNVSLGLEGHPLSRSERKARIMDTLVRTGLDAFADLYPKQLSGGMQQRVGIARAMAVRPSVLLLDEPLSALDAQTRDLLLEDFENLWLKEQTTAVYVTHNLNEAIRLSDRVAVLSRRPGTLREIVDVTVPREERSGNAATLELHDRLWQLIREEAAMADREVSHV